MDLTAFFDYPDRQGAESPDELVFLAQWGDDDWSRLLRHTETRRFRSGEVVIRQGDVDRTVHIVSSGRLEAFVARGTDGRIHFLNHIDQGSIFGEQAFLDGRPRSATVRALTEATTFCLSHAGFETFAAREPILAQAVLLDLGRVVSIRLRRALASIAALVG